MASLQLPATMEKLPGDVLSKIFIRLLAKQVAQMRCVSKTWNALLSQPSFVKSQLDHSIRNNDALLLFFYKARDDLTGPFSVHPSNSPHLELNNFIKDPDDLKSYGASVGGSVNGLICLYNGSHNRYTVQIWNPSLSAVLTLPPYSMPSCGPDPVKIAFWFGYDPKSDDYKVIKLASLLRPPSDMDPILADLLGLSFFNVKEWLEVEVYSMKKGSWKVITQRFPSHITKVSRQDKICVDGHDGHLHWLGFIDEKRELQTVVAFDMDVEKFSEIPLPDSILDHNVSNRYNVLGLLDEKLCVMSCVDVDGGKCEVWLMEEYGVAESWVKHQVFSQFSGRIYPYGFTLHNEFFFQDGNGSLALFNPITEKVKSFKITGRALMVRKVVNYVDSLVWVAPFEHDISSCSISRLQI